MQSDQTSITKPKNRVLIVLFIALVLIGVGLIVTIVWLNNKPESDSQENVETVDIPSEMEGYEGPVSDSTRALVFAQNIQDRLSADPNFTHEQVINEFDAAYKQSSGDLKLYLAIEYANYLYQTDSNINEAMSILENIEYTENTRAEMDYLNAVYDLYAKSGDTQKAEEYNQLIKSKIPENTVIYDVTKEQQ